MLNVVFLSRNRGSFIFELAAQLHVFSIVGTVKAPFVDGKFLGATAPPCANDTAFAEIVCHPFIVPLGAVGWCQIEWGQISFRYSETDR